MKKTRLLVLMLALALLVCGAIGITASAETEPTLTLKKNVSFVDTPSLVFAVEGVEAEADVELRVYASAEATEYYTATAIEGGVVIDEVEYPAFYLAGIYPKDIANEVYVKAVSGDKESAMLRYSILEFALEGIDTYKGVNDELAAFYQNIIDYSSGIQKYIGDTDTNVADYNYVKVEDGTIGGYSTAVLADGEYTVTLTGSAPAGLTHIGWTVGATEFTGNTVTISESCTVAPKYEASNNPVMSDYQTFSDITLNGTTLVGTKKMNKVSVATLKTGETVEIADDPTDAANKVLKYVDIVQSSGASAIRVGEAQVSQAISTFEARVYIPSADYKHEGTREYIGQWGFYKGGDKKTAFDISYDAENNFVISCSNTEENDSIEGSATYKVDADTIFDQWVVIRFEHHNSTDTTKIKTLVYINNQLVLTCNRYKDAADVNNFRVCGYSSSAGTVYFDDMSFTEVAFPAE
ncbi:MAG: hypothetical protein IJ515_00060 [Clostridia bacterium]|nr:hypothetical protein [Clostridia bacterium]